jgi:hypothetical protein
VVGLTTGYSLEGPAGYRVGGGDMKSQMSEGWMCKVLSDIQTIC